MSLDTTRSIARIVYNNKYEIPVDSLVKPAGILTVKENGTYDVQNYAWVEVQTPSIDGSKLSKLVDGTITTITEEDLAGAKIISDYAFYSRTSLTNVVLPSGLTSIRQYAFYGCSSLKNITIPEGVTLIANYVFYNCNKISEITIPASITTIGTRTFGGSFCGNIKILATKPPSLPTTESISSSVNTIYIPAGTLSAYQSAATWSSFSSKFVELEA